jgi:hypothetical protein
MIRSNKSIYHSFVIIIMLYYIKKKPIIFILTANK